MLTICQRSYYARGLLFWGSIQCLTVHCYPRLFFLPRRSIFGTSRSS